MYKITPKNPKLTVDTLAAHIAMELAENTPKFRAMPLCPRGGVHKNKKAYNRKLSKAVSY